MRGIRASHLIAAALTMTLAATPAAATEWHVAAGAAGDGSASSPFGRVQDALQAAQPGDTITIGTGTFPGRLTSVRPGRAGQPITIRGAGGRAAGGQAATILTASGRVLTVAHPDIAVEGLVLDGQFGADDIVRVESAAARFVLRNTEVRRTSRDAVDMGAVEDVLIDGALIHDALDAAGGRTDAHGIVAGAARRLTIRNTEIHTFSGDAIQIDPDRGDPGWTDVLIEHCRLWLEPLRAATNGFPAGTVPGENAVDTKAGTAWPRARLTIKDTEAFGFRNGLITNMAAFNIKEHVDVVVDSVTVHDSEIAFRLRAPAQVQLSNVVIHSVDSAVRYEDGIQGLRVWNTTIGNGVGKPFQPASSPGSTLDVRNLLVLGTALPAEAKGRSNLAVPASAFANAAAHDYRLSAGSPALDAGVAIAEVRADRLGTARPQGAAYDVGAFERPVPTRSPATVHGSRGTGVTEGRSNGGPLKTKAWDTGRGRRPQAGVRMGTGQHRQAAAESGRLADAARYPFDRAYARSPTLQRDSLRSPFLRFSPFAAVRSQRDSRSSRSATRPRPAPRRCVRRHDRPTGAASGAPAADPSWTPRPR